MFTALNMKAGVEASLPCYLASQLQITTNKSYSGISGDIVAESATERRHRIESDIGMGHVGKQRCPDSGTSRSEIYKSNSCFSVVF